MTLMHISLRFMAAAIVVLAFSLGGCERSQPPGSAQTAKPASGQPATKPAPEKAKTPAGDARNCAGFTAGDASALLGVPPEQITVNIKESYSGFWLCSYSTAKTEKSLNFSVAIAKDEKTAIADMAQYRSNLEFAATTAPHKGSLPSGAYSEISPLGDENVWTDVNGTLTVRKGAVSIQIQTPPGKMAQIKAAQAILSKL